MIDISQKLLSWYMAIIIFGIKLLKVITFVNVTLPNRK